MEIIEDNLSLASSERILKLIQEANNELAKIQPEIDYLEGCQQKLEKLKAQKQKLSALVLSLNSILKISDVNNKNNENINNILETKIDINVNNQNVNYNNLRKVFLPDQAFSQVKNYLRTKNNLNYEIFKAVVFNSGEATTEQIKQYLIENNIKQPKTGKGFEDVELKEISSRANYLVRKNILVAPESGIFRSVFGWSEIE